MEKKAFYKTATCNVSIFMGLFILIHVVTCLLVKEFAYLMGYVGGVFYLIWSFIAVVAIITYFITRKNIDFNQLKIQSVSFPLYIISSICIIALAMSVLYEFIYEYHHIFYSILSATSMWFIPIIVMSPIAILGIINLKIIFKLLQNKYNINFTYWYFSIMGIALVPYIIFSKNWDLVNFLCIIAFTFAHALLNNNNNLKINYKNYKNIPFLLFTFALPIYLLVSHLVSILTHLSMLKFESFLYSFDFYIILILGITLTLRTIKHQIFILGS